MSPRRNDLTDAQENYTRMCQLRLQFRELDHVLQGSPALRIELAAAAMLRQDHDTALDWRGTRLALPT
jgi:hypothetical protein